MDKNINILVIVEDKYFCNWQKDTIDTLRDLTNVEVSVKNHLSQSSVKKRAMAFHYFHKSYLNKKN